MDSFEKKNYNQPYLTGSYIAKLDSKKRVKIPKQIMYSLIVLNNSERKLYLQKTENKIIGYSLSAVEKLKKELGDLSFIDKKTIKKMEELGSTLYETSIMGDDRIVIPDIILSGTDIKLNSEVKIKGAFEFITISKNNK